MADRALVRRYLEQLRELGDSDFVLDRFQAKDFPALLKRAGASAWRETLLQSGVEVEPQIDRRRSAATPATTETDMKRRKAKVVDDASELFEDEIAKLRSLKAIAEKVLDCRRCSLYTTALNGVPGEGSGKAEVVCVGEGPGATEDETGRPFVGAAGALLTKILA